jgi:UDP-N-acetylmuramyl pentapeptide phosphotransferase/UDP-N-acetylglucosamine-1-phosphate transferase
VSFVSGHGIIGAMACCGAVVVIGEPVAVPLLRRLHAIDIPGERSSHCVPTPRGGGAPIAVGLLAATGLAGGGASVAFMTAIAFFGLLGFADDLRTLPAPRRLAFQALGSAGVALLLILPLHLAAPVLAAATVATAVWITGFVNVYNFMDGVNGISATHALIAGAAYACYGEWVQQRFLLTAGLLVAVGALLFLPWNAGRARVFLGDVGSYTLGAALAVIAACAVLRGLPPEAAIGPLALYLTDTAWTLQRRIRAGERWLQPHRTHVYQRWCDVGWSHQEVTLLTGAISVLLGLLGTASLTGNAALRASADLAGLAILAAYLGSPVWFRRLGLRGELS